jgi:AcrR family transcriptional regulator
MPRKSLVPQQARSRESLGRLMKAAREILNEKGIEGATVPRVAARAGLSPGSVYRRFRNKDALMRAVILETRQALDAAVVSGLTPELAERLSLREFVEGMVRHSVASHRQDAGMLRSILQYTLAHADMAFTKKIAELDARSLQRVVEFLLLKRQVIDHPHPRKALAIGLLLVRTMLQQIIVLEAQPHMTDALPRWTDDELVDELTRAFLRYLGVKDKPRRAPSHRTH